MSDDHRPGPWQLSKYRDGSSIIIIDAEGFDVCAVHYPNRDATARLIASAPDMAAEIERLRSENEGYATSYDALSAELAAERQRARLPEELVARLREIRSLYGSPHPRGASGLLDSILAAVEQGERDE